MSLETEPCAHGAYDPYVPVIKLTREHPEWAGTRSVEWKEELIKSFDLALVSTAHKDVNYEEMLEAYNHSFKNISEGAVVSGTILKVSDSHVVVDVGFKSEGRISADEFRDEEGNLEIKPGDKVDVLLERTERNDQTPVVLEHLHDPGPRELVERV